MIKLVNIPMMILRLQSNSPIGRYIGVTGREKNYVGRSENKVGTIGSPSF